MEENYKQVKEEFGDAIHKIWSHWMKHLFTKGYDNSDGTFRICWEKVEQWRRQMNTPYSELTREDQQKDLDIFDKFMEKPIMSFAEVVGEKIADRIVEPLKEKND